MPMGGGLGLLWAGRGLSLAADAGVEYANSRLTIRFAPEVTFAQNLPGSTRVVKNAGFQPWAYPLYDSRIDLPQRFGPGTVTMAGFGQSTVELRGLRLKAGLSTESQWWGPGIRNGLIFSDNAPGFTRLYFGTDRSIPLWLVRLDFQLQQGKLQATNYQLTTPPSPTRGDRYLSSFIVNLAPRRSRVVELGLMRLWDEYLPGFDLKEVKSLILPHPNPSRNGVSFGNTDDQRDQMFSLFARVHPTADAAEFYGEWVRNDSWVDERDLSIEPEHSHGGTVGFQNKWSGPGFTDHVLFEVTSLARSRVTALRAGSDQFYLHTGGAITEGYTNRGRIIGAQAGIGGRMAVFRYDRWRDTVDRAIEVTWNQPHPDAASTNPGKPVPPETRVGVRYEWGRRLWGWRYLASASVTRVMNLWAMPGRNLYNIGTTLTVTPLPRSR